MATEPETAVILLQAKKHGTGQQPPEAGRGGRTRPQGPGLGARGLQVVSAYICCLSHSHLFQYLQKFTQTVPLVAPGGSSEWQGPHRACCSGLSSPSPANPGPAPAGLVAAPQALTPACPSRSRRPPQHRPAPLILSGNVTAKIKHGCVSSKVTRGGMLFSLSDSGG